MSWEAKVVMTFDSRAKALAWQADAEEVGIGKHEGELDESPEPEEW